MACEQEKDRESRAGDYAVTPHSNAEEHIDGTHHDSSNQRVQQDILLWKHGYDVGLREGLAKGPAHPVVQRSVARMFGDWQGAHASLAQSVQRFWRDYRGAV